MTCTERLSHAIQVDKIKIYPNSTTIIEKTQKRNVIEDHYERTGQKHLNNYYHDQHDNYQEEYNEMLDSSQIHDVMMEHKDQTWYFVIADCEGRLEVFTDDVTQRDHLLGLNEFWVDIEDAEFAGKETS
jgi:hypothetical protein